MMPFLYACVCARAFPAQALLRLRTEMRAEAVAVIEGEAPFERVCSLNRAAMQQGISEGMTRAKAELYPVRLLRRSLKEEANARNALAAMLGQYSPAIEEQSTDTACIYVLDIRGTEKLLGTSAELCNRITTQAATLGFAVHVVVSSNFDTALCLAASASCRTLCVPREREAQYLECLPLHALQLSPEQADTFRDWGLRCIGDLAALPDIELIARLGQPGYVLQQRARGCYQHHFQPIQLPFALEEFVEFDDPVDSLESLLFVLHPMLEQLVVRAATRAYALASVTVSFGLEDKTTHQRSIRPALPSEDHRALVKLLQLDLSAHPPQAGVLSLTVSAEPGTRSKIQGGLFSPEAPEPMRLELTMARIASVVGDGRIGKAQLQDSHRDGIFQMGKFDAAVLQGKSAAMHNPVTPALHRLRPPLEIPVNGRQPKSLTYLGAHYRMVRLYGPWRASGDWWSGEVWSIDCWDFAALAQNDSLLLGVLSHDRMRNAWKLEAFYD